MGATLSSTPERLAMGAMCHVVRFDKVELLALRAELARVASTADDKYHTVSRVQFTESLAVAGIADTDKEVMDKVFTLLDDAAEDRVNFREFLVTVAPICRGPLADRLRFVLELYDVDDSRKLSRDELSYILRAMNRALTFFGDSPMDDKRLHSMVDELYGEEAVEMELDELLPVLSKHTTLARFVSEGFGAE